MTQEQIISLALDVLANAKYRNPIELDKHIRDQITDSTKRYYVFIDEIQFVSQIQNPYVDDPKATLGFIDVVLGLMQIPNADIYVTGMLSSDILNQFRDRGDEVRVHPLSFAEFYEGYTDDKRGAWQDYYTYGGMPVVTSLDTHEEKSRYLSDLFTGTYLKDVLERHKVNNETEVLGILLDILASSVGSLTNPSKLSNTFKTEIKKSVSSDTIESYLGFFTDVFIIRKAERFDVKGKKYIKTPAKYYYSDVGLRNARLGFRQLEETHLMENVIYNDLLRRDLDVDVGVVEYNTRNSAGKSERRQLEVDFVVNRGSERYYIQSALSVADPAKREQETASLLRIPDSFKKIVIVKDYLKPQYDEHGIMFVGAEQFLLDENLL